MKVYPCGTAITPKLNNSMPGFITAVCIRFTKASYEIGYFLNGEYKTAWLVEEEFTTDADKHEIGFKQ